MGSTFLRVTAGGLFLLALGTGPVWARRAAAPANDNFVDRIVLTGNSVSATGSNVSATKEAGEPNHAGNAGGHSVWWSWTAPATGDVTISTAGSAFDTVLGVYTGSSVGSLLLTASDDDGGSGTTSQVSFTAVGGTAYRIAVDGYGGATGAISLSIVNVITAIAYATNFDSGVPGWTFDAPVNGSAWAADATPASFPNGISRTSLSLNFNNGTDYAGATSGGALSPLISLAGVTNPVLEFWCNYNTETRGPGFDQRCIQVWNSKLTTKLADWHLASTGYSFDPAGGIVGVGPGPCGEAYIDLETGTPVTSWHMHRIYLDPAWGSIRLRFVFWSVDDQRNNYAGWAIDDLMVRSHQTAAPTGWPDNSPDTVAGDGDGNELDICQRSGNLLKWSWGCSNLGDVGVHMLIGNHPQSILHESFMFYDTSHGHYHLSQYSDFSLWKSQPFGFQKVQRGPKRSFCLTDVDTVIAGAPSISPGCGGVFQAISYGHQDVYALGTSGQELDITGLATGTDYYLVGVIDPLNRLRETNNLNQTDQIHFTLPAADGQVALILPRTTPYPPTPTPLAITAATVGTFQGSAAIHVTGTGFDTTLVPILYDTDTTVAEAPFYTIVSASEIWVTIPSAAGFGAIASLDLIRARGDATSFRIAGGGAATPPPADPVAGPLTVVAPGGAAFSGSIGGAFLPASLDFTVSNPGTAPITWEAVRHEGWVMLSSSTGVLAPGASAVVSVSIGSAAVGLPAAVYADPVFFVNTTNGSGSTVRPVTLTVSGAAPQLAVSPAAPFISAGAAGGPFAPASFGYVLVNNGAADLNWTAAKTQPWLALSSAGGTLTPGEKTTVTLSFAAAANALAAGLYADTVTFTNATNGNGNTLRSVSLDVGSAAPPTLTIVPPPATASASPLILDGSAGGTNLTAVVWSNGATGGSGTATGTATWTATIPLASGPNAITVTAFDDSGASVSQTFVVDAALPASAGGGGGGGCGATGLEVAFLIAGLALFRRRWN
jgi:hypothetical protein